MKTNTHDLLLPSYFGGLGSKSGLCHELNPRYPAESFSSHCVLFAGGLGDFFGKPKARLNIVNDIDPDVIETHSTVAAMPLAVMAELEKLRPSRLTFTRLRGLRECAEWHSLSPPERSAAFIYLVKNSVNGNMRAFSNSSKSRSTYNPHYDLRPYAAKLDKVTFENLHWRDFLHRFVMKPREVRMGLYADPPYVTSDTEKHYRFNFDSTEHLLLAEYLTRITALNDRDRRNVKLLISYDDDPNGFIRSLYRPELGWHIETIEVRYESEHRANRCRNELVIMNYEPTSN